jgi:hypothetical protein
LWVPYPQMFLPAIELVKLHLHRATDIKPHGARRP